MQKNCLFFRSHDDSSEPAPLALSQLTTQECKQTSQKSASKMLISMEGPKLKDTKSESSTVIIVVSTIVRICSDFLRYHIFVHG